MPPKGMTRIMMDRTVYPPWLRWNCRCLKIDRRVLFDGLYPVVGSSVAPYRVAAAVVVYAVDVAVVGDVGDAAAVDDVAAVVAVHIDIDIVAVGGINVVLDKDYDCTYPAPMTKSHGYHPDHQHYYYYQYHHHQSRHCHY